MKKISTYIFLILTILLLSSCNKTTEEDYPIDLEVTVLSEITDESNITINVLVPITVNSLDDLLEITLNIASQTYERHFQMIGSNSYQLRINLFKDASSVNQTPEYGYHVFIINQSITNPGLTLSTNGLKLE